MCQHNKIHYAICGHQRNLPTRCDLYLSGQKNSCEKKQFNETHHSLCPKCSYKPTPVSLPKKTTVSWNLSAVSKSSNKPAPINLPKSTTVSSNLSAGSASTDKPTQTSLPKSTTVSSNLSAGSASSGKLSLVRSGSLMASNGLRSLVGSIKRGRSRRESHKVTKSNISNTTNTTNYSSFVETPSPFAQRIIPESDRSTMSSEQLAEEYRSILDEHPRLSPSFSSNDFHKTSSEDDRQTTWGNLITEAKQEDSLAERERLEKLRLADERFARVRDGRGTFKRLVTGLLKDK